MDPSISASVHSVQNSTLDAREDQSDAKSLAKQIAANYQDVEGANPTFLLNSGPEDPLDGPEDRELLNQVEKELKAILGKDVIVREGPNPSKEDSEELGKGW